MCRASGIWLFNLEPVGERKGCSRFLTVAESKGSRSVEEGAVEGDGLHENEGMPNMESNPVGDLGRHPTAMIGGIWQAPSMVSFQWDGNVNGLSRGECLETYHRKWQVPPVVLWEYPLWSGKDDAVKGGGLHEKEAIPNMESNPVVNSGRHPIVMISGIWKAPTMASFQWGSYVNGLCRVWVSGNL
ncbi:hypothetical protein NE237_009138 [Protea cynaroides]|uniref:Uncharacterized protein n=1 Tax=Protea cynaroides TaxID=273540 RepID=A0A9Q0R006_9MAGN|nr:hypothetical protein NE237_009138 [Protea cynaroides]